MQAGSKGYIASNNGALAGRPFWVRVLAVENGMAVVKALGRHGKDALSDSNGIAMIAVENVKATLDEAREGVRRAKLATAMALVDSLESQLLEAEETVRSLESSLDDARSEASSLGGDTESDEDDSSSDDSDDEYF